MLLSLNVLDMKSEKLSSDLGQVTVFASVSGPLSDHLASCTVHERLRLEQASSSRLHHNYKVKGRQTSVIFRFFVFRHRPLIRLFRQSINISLRRIVRPQRDDFTCHFNG